MRSVVAVTAVLAAAVAATSSYGHERRAGTSASDTAGRSTLEQTLRGADPEKGFAFLGTGPGEAHLVRQELVKAKDGRAGRRRSLVYFGQITDFQLSDEESPARVEFSDADPSGTASSAWRPQETLVAHETDAAIRQMNRFLTSPVRQGNGKRAKLLNAVMTGDLADNQQRNETQWVIQLLEGGTVNPNSGTTNYSTCSAPTALAAQAALDPNEHKRYTGVQDYDDYLGSTNFYDPDSPQGQYSDWPRYPGLVDKAQLPFEAEGLKVPSYIAFGNHDGLVQGNEDANRGFEDVAIGCVKPTVPAGPLGPSSSLEDALPPGAFDALDPSYLQGVFANPAKAMLVPPDANRRFVDKAEFKRLSRTGQQDDAHGFAYVDKDELEASNGAAAYYSFSPKKGIRYIVLDTVSEAGVTPFSSDGNIDDPQFKWLESELKAATKRDELILVMGHHATGSSMTADVPDEVAAPCTVADSHGHDTNPGCDRDPRSSEPIHLGDDLTALFHKYPHVVTYIAGHSHENEIAAFKKSGGGDYWEIKSPAVVDWPPQHRLIEVMDNKDGTLSIFGTLLEIEAPSRAAASGTAASTLDREELTSVGRTLTYNDPHGGPDGSEGKPRDRNVELLIRDPRRSAAALEDDEEESGGGDDSGDGSSDEDGSGGAAAAGTSGGSLPFTGYLVLPLLLLGLGLAALGTAIRRLR